MADSRILNVMLASKMAALSLACVLVTASGCDTDLPKPTPAKTEHRSGVEGSGPKAATKKAEQTPQQANDTALGVSDGHTANEPKSAPRASATNPTTKPSAKAVTDAVIAQGATKTSKALAAKQRGPEKTEAPKAAEEPKQTVRGATISEEAFSAYLQATGPFTVGNQTQATVVLTAKSPFKCNDKYPYKFKTTGGETLRGAQVGKKTTTLQIPFTPKQAGKTTVGGTFHFSVCTEDQCLIKRAKLSVSLTAS